MVHREDGFRGEVKAPITQGLLGLGKSLKFVPRII